MLTQKITKKISSKQELYKAYLGVLEAMTSIRLTNQEKEVLSRIMVTGSVTKDLKKDLLVISSRARIENIISKLRSKKLLVGNEPNPRLKMKDNGKLTMVITLDAED